VVATLTVAVELWEQLLAWERELESREGAVVVREDGLASSECALGRIHMEHNAKHTQAKAIRQDYLARMRTFTASCRHSFNFDQILEER
jgi:hypothetical protein